MNNFDSNNSNGTENPKNPRPEIQGLKTITLGPRELWLLLVSFVLFVASGAAPFPLSLVSLIVIAPLYAVFSYRLGNHFSFFVPMVAFITCFVITGDIACALFILPATAMSYFILNSVNSGEKGAKTSAVVGCTVSLVVFILIQLAVAILLKEQFTLKELAGFINAYFDTVKNAFADSITAYSAALTEMLAESGNTLSEQQLAAFDPVLLKKQIDAVFYMTKMTLPAIITLYCILISYLSASLLGPISRICGAKKLLDGADYSVSVSGIAIVVYFISSIGGLFASGAAYFGFRNVTYILSPALMLCGIKQIGAFLMNKGMSKHASVILQVVACLIALFSGNLGTTILIMLGMFYVSKNAHSAH